MHLLDIVGQRRGWFLPRRAGEGVFELRLRRSQVLLYLSIVAWLLYMALFILRLLP